MCPLHLPASAADVATSLSPSVHIEAARSGAKKGQIMWIMISFLRLLSFGLSIFCRKAPHFPPIHFPERLPDSLQVSFCSPHSQHVSQPSEITQRNVSNFRSVLHMVSEERDTQYVCKVETLIALNGNNKNSFFKFNQTYTQQRRNRATPGDIAKWICIRISFDCAAAAAAVGVQEFSSPASSSEKRMVIFNSLEEQGISSGFWERREKKLHSTELYHNIVRIFE